MINAPKDIQLNITCKNKPFFPFHWLRGFSPCRQLRSAENAPPELRFGIRVSNWKGKSV